MSYISRGHLYRLVYISQSLVELLDRGGAAAIGDILSASVMRNSLLGITGALTFDEQHFAQVLEGEKSSVRRVFDSIARDRRHTAVQVVGEGWIEARDFSQWAMAYVGARNAPNLVAVNPDLNDVIKDGSPMGQALVDMMRFLLGKAH
jgi:hypothetical protein